MFIFSGKLLLISKLESHQATWTKENNLNFWKILPNPNILPRAWAPCTCPIEVEVAGVVSDANGHCQRTNYRHMWDRLLQNRNWKFHLNLAAQASPTSLPSPLQHALSCSHIYRHPRSSFILSMFVLPLTSNALLTASICIFPYLPLSLWSCL